MNAVKKTIRKFSLFFLFFSCFAISKAQSPYTHGIGATVGNMFGVSYKTFATDNFAIQLDLSVRMCPTAHVFDKETAAFLEMSSETITLYSLDFNPNFMYESDITRDLYWFAGGGVTIGYGFAEGVAGFTSYGHSGIFGINAIGGIEYQFNAPVALQFDFRPGYGLNFSKGYHKSMELWHYFNWGIAATVRYTF